ncbi:hypothetical protein [Sphingomonas oligophenolica]|uniref:Uncharacterized protein n=1 Tax=Sphingomonas oligophenolica TaxID=301154 RepID=A0A502C0Q6_9SPHN|nr:hypothetical protein [Sphingomonas oligophenolica]TPG06368.1 hypothetical protein EAH84_14945 [Sphingomonas oligophenolica]
MTEAMMVHDTSGNAATDCDELGALLGLDAPVALAVFARAVNDAAYARSLILCRENPAFRDFLLAQADGWVPPVEAAVADHGAIDLTAKAILSFWAWTKSGFAMLDADAAAARFAACLACPHLGAAPDRLVFRLAGASSDADRHRVCGLCGCVAARKARLPHERCPGPDPDRAGLNRWGQPLAEVAAARERTCEGEDQPM